MNVRVDSVGRRDVLTWWLVGVLGAAGVWALAAWTPSTAQEDTVCLLRRSTGLACPGCGMGRAAAALARGDWSEATRLHPLVWILASEAVAIWWLWGGVVRGWWRAPRAVWLGRFAIANAALFVIVWIARAVT